MPDEAEKLFAADWQAWRERRLAAVNAPDGSAALRRTAWLGEAAETIVGLPGRWSVEGEAVRVQLATSDDAVVDGHPTSGSFLAQPLSEEHRSSIRFPTATVQVTRRSGRLGLRVFEHARAGAVERIEAFTPDPAWRLEGEIVPVEGEAIQPYEFGADGATRGLSAPVIVSFTLGGRRYEARPFPDGKKLVLVFADETTGVTSKAPCRFLNLVPPPLARGRVVLDFNRSYLPPCAFSDEFNCPLPPPGHRFSSSVTAGEREVVWSSTVWRSAVSADPVPTAG